jgi:hypothetical protein
MGPRIEEAGKNCPDPAGCTLSDATAITSNRSQGMSDVPVMTGGKYCPT